MISAMQQTVRAQYMLTENPGLLTVEKGESTADITQDDIRKNVDIQSANKVKLHSAWYTER